MLLTEVHRFKLHYSQNLSPEVMPQRFFNLQFMSTIPLSFSLLESTWSPLASLGCYCLELKGFATLELAIEAAIKLDAKVHLVQMVTIVIMEASVIMGFVAKAFAIDILD